MIASSIKYLHGNLTVVVNRLMNLVDTPVAVLAYHRVNTLTHDPQLLAVTPRHFRFHLEHLKNTFPVLRFEDDWTSVKEPSVVITFDDGYADNVLEALPIIEEVGVPVTFFISTGTIGTHVEFWWDELERIILNNGVERERFNLRDTTYEKVWATLLQTDRETLYRDMHSLMKQVCYLKRVEWLDQLREWACVSDVGRESHRAMNFEELLCLASSKWVTIGAHTVWHDSLAALPIELQETELIKSKMYLEDLTNNKITVFSYPFGAKNDYTRETISLCRKAGYLRAASNFPGLAHRWTDSFQIPRYLIRNWPLDTYKSKIKEFIYS